MSSIRTEIEIHATAKKVWDVLADFTAYPRWNPVIRSVAGMPEVGKPLQASILMPSGREMKIRPKLLAFSPGRELRWRGGLLLPGIFDGEHYFVIEELAGGGVRFRHGESFSGILAPLLYRMIAAPFHQAYVAMNEALKREAEQ